MTTLHSWSLSSLLEHLLPHSLVDGVHLVWSFQLHTEHIGSCLGHVEGFVVVGHGVEHQAGGGVKETFWFQKIETELGRDCLGDGNMGAGDI